MTSYDRVTSDLTLLNQPLTSLLGQGVDSQGIKPSRGNLVALQGLLGPHLSLVPWASVCPGLSSTLRCSHPHILFTGPLSGLTLGPQGQESQGHRLARHWANENARQHLKPEAGTDRGGVEGHAADALYMILATVSPWVAPLSATSLQAW